MSVVQFIYHFITKVLMKKGVMHKTASVKRLVRFHEIHEKLPKGILLHPSSSVSLRELYFQLNDRKLRGDRE